MTKQLHFWDSTSELYEDTSLTMHKSDGEMDFVKDVLDSHKFDGFVCAGCADACRDPKQMLEYLTEKKMTLPTSIKLNDLSPKLLKTAEKKLIQYDKINIEYYPNPVNIVTKEKLNLPDNCNPCVIIGVYNSNYIKPSLKGYKDNKSIIGTDFEICAVVLENNKLVQNSKVIKFKINNYLDVMDDIYKLKEIKNFVAYSIITNTGFISHYYEMNNFKNMCNIAFKNKTIDVVKRNGRYIIAYIRKPNNTKFNWLITCLNNVAGNIPYNDQLDSLETINRWL